MDEHSPTRKPQTIRITLSQVNPTDDPRYIEIVHDAITIGIQLGEKNSRNEVSILPQDTLALEVLETKVRAEVTAALNQANAIIAPTDQAENEVSGAKKSLVEKAKQSLIDHIVTGSKEGVKWAVRLLASLAAGG